MGVAEVFNNTSACVSVFTTLPLQLKTFEVETKGFNEPFDMGSG
jgi:hypothetical protein